MGTTAPSKYITVINTADEFFSALGRLPNAEIVGWIVYVLEGFDDPARGADAEDVLTDLRQAIDIRLANGGW